MPLPFSGRVALGDGRRSLTLLGDSLKCGDVRQVQAGTSVSVDVMVSSDSRGWTVHALDSNGGSFEIRIERMLGSGMFGSVPLSGSAQGYAIDSSTEFFNTPTGTVLTFAPPGGVPVPLSGQMPFASLATGEFRGAIAFSRNDVVATCPAGAVLWSLTNSSIP